MISVDFSGGGSDDAGHLDERKPGTGDTGNADLTVAPYGRS
ncbi:MAG: hypothetical protein ACKVIQ_06685 [Acidimicrobiales bacterium]